MRVLDVWILTLFATVSREKRSFWKVSFSLFAKISWKMRALESDKTKGKEEGRETEWVRDREGKRQEFAFFFLARCAISALAVGRDSLCHWSVATTLA